MVKNRKVSLAPSNTEILFAIGFGDRVIGVTEYCNYPEEAKEKEKIVALQPELILAAHGVPVEVRDALVRFNFTVVGLYPKNLDDVLYDIRLVGEITDELENASFLTAKMARRCEEVENKLKEAVDEKTSVLHVVWHDPLWITGKGTVEEEVIERSGEINAASVEGYKKISLESGTEANPDVIITTLGTGMGSGSKNIYTSI